MECKNTLLRNNGLLHFLILFFATYLFTSYTNVSLQNDGSIGDIKYSILPPDRFIKYNGTDWMLLGGYDTQLSQTIYSDGSRAKALFLASKLHLEEGEKELPDARGLFLRGMNLGRDVNTGDTWSNRIAGSYQKDTFEQHTHMMRLRHFAELNFSRGIDPPRTGAQSGSHMIDGSETTPNGKAETRPRNIAVYIYIKVN